MRTKRAGSPCLSRLARLPRASRPPRFLSSPGSSRRLAGAAAIACLPLIVLLAGCSGGASGSSAVGAANSGALASGAAAAPQAGTANGAGSASSSSSAVAGGGSSAGSQSAAKYAAAGRQLIYNAQLSVRATDVSAALSRATSIVAGAGGYVSAEDASAGQGKPGQATATVTFEIPVSGYAAALAALSGGGLGTRLSLSQQAQDVTQQVADVSSRVTSDEAAIAQLRALLRHAGDVNSLLSVQNQIDSEESDLESMLAQQNALDHETAYATVALTLLGPAAPARPRAKAAPPPGLVRGLSAGWHALRVTVTWLLAILGALAPFLAVAAAVAALAWWARRRLSRRPRKPAAGTSSGDS